MRLLNILFALLITFQLSASTTASSPESTQDRPLNEIIDAGFSKGVELMAGVFFWDPFEAMGIYDPVVYENGIPYVDQHLRGVIQVDKGSAEVKGTSTNFVQDLSKGSRVIIDNKVYRIADVRDANHLTLKEPVHLSVEAGHMNTAATQNIPFIVVWLVFGAVFFTIKMRFINFRGIPLSIKLLRGHFTNPDDKGEVSHFQALTTALSGTVGLGNIASVAVAITIGGPGATFWMIVAGLFGMASKFVECTLGVKYRVFRNGVVSGGPMYYLKYGLQKRGLGKLGSVLAVIFSILVIGGAVGGGNMFQANQAMAQLEQVYPAAGDHKILLGLIMATLVGVVIIGGVKSIAKVTEKIVPFMAGIYVLSALVVIIANYENIIPSFGLIIDGAFNASALKGGFLGVLLVGFQRAAFSNEAGIGSSSIAHSAAKTDEPVSEGLVALVEPFIDTVVICTMTALVIVISGKYTNELGLEGAQLTSSAFETVISWFPYLLSVAIFLFAFSTIISWSYYGLKGWTYLFGNSTKMEIIFKVLFLSFVIVGASSSLGAVIDFADMMILGMGLPNIIGLLIMSGEVKSDLKSYMERVNSGAIKQYREKAEAA